MFSFFYLLYSRLHSFPKLNMSQSLHQSLLKEISSIYNTIRFFCYSFHCMLGFPWLPKCFIWFLSMQGPSFCCKDLWGYPSELHDVATTGIPRFMVLASLCFTHIYIFFLMKDLWQPCSRASLLASFFQQHLLTSCLILVTLVIFKMFYYYIHDDYQSSVVFDVMVNELLDT